MVVGEVLGVVSRVWQGVPIGRRERQMEGDGRETEGRGHTRS